MAHLDLPTAEARAIAARSLLAKALSELEALDRGDCGGPDATDRQLEAVGAAYPLITAARAALAPATHRLH